LTLLLIVIGGLSTAGAAAVGFVIYTASKAPSIDSLKPVNKGATSVVYAANGERLGFIKSDVLRTPVSGAKISPWLKKATVAIEDERFYKHKGVDYVGVVRAAVKNLESGKTVEGGSTLTMQLVRALYISSERTYKRKIKEAALAQQLESKHNKEWILNKYVNSIPFGTVGGQTAVGAQAAARVFFDKTAKNLTLEEAALLAGLPQAPSLYNPFNDPAAARARRNDVLQSMADQEMITQTQANKAMQTKITVKATNYYKERKQDYFLDYVQQELIDKYGVNVVRKGGIRVDTTIDPKLQELAKNAIKSQLAQTTDPAAAIVSIDPKNGYIKAMASSADYSDSKFNLVTQGKRQPGSTFKTFALTAGVNQGVDPASTTYSGKNFDMDTLWGPWKVSNFDGRSAGYMSLVKATLTSSNTVYGRFALDIGPDVVKQTARKLGIKSKLNGYPAETLGGVPGVSPLEMTNAYTTIASGGIRFVPKAITRVKFSDGEIEDLAKPKSKKEFKDGVTATVTDILHQNVLGGTGTNANIRCPAAGKTGTTDNFTDAWFIGFTPKLVTGVWVGYPQSTQISMPGMTGGSTPATIWGNYMSNVVASDSECPDFAEPKEPVTLQAFFGEHATTGEEDPEDKPDKEDTDEKDKEKNQTDEDNSQDGSSPDSGSGNGGNYDDGRKYETPPQGDPKVDTPDQGEGLGTP